MTAPLPLSSKQWQAVGKSSASVSARQRWLRMGRAVMVGAWATIADLLVLTFCIRVARMDVTAARAFGLAAGWLVLFFGNRWFAFRAQAGSLSRQASLFVVAELVGLPLNLLSFHVLFGYLPFLAPEIVSLPANFVIFVAYFYPVRRFIIFRVNEELGRGAMAEASVGPASIGPSSIGPASIGPAALSERGR